MEIKQFEALITEKKKNIHDLEVEKNEKQYNLGIEFSKIPQKAIKGPKESEIRQKIEQNKRAIDSLNKTIDKVKAKSQEINNLENELKEIRLSIDEQGLILKDKYDFVGREFYTVISSDPKYSTYKDLYADHDNIQKEITELKDKLKALEDEEKGFFKKIKEGFNSMIIKNNIKTKEKEIKNLFPLIGNNLIQSDFFSHLKDEEHKDLKELINNTKSELARLQKAEKDNIMLKEKKLEDLNEMTQHTRPDSFIKTKEAEVIELNKSLDENYLEAGQLITNNKLGQLTEDKDFGNIYSEIKKIIKAIESNNNEIEKINFGIEYLTKTRQLEELQNKEERIKVVIEQHNQELNALKDQIKDTKNQIDISRKNAGNYITS